MVPSSKALIEGIRHGLELQVTPVVTDRVALSVLKSIDLLLQHLAARVEVEHHLLATDNAELRSLLGLPAVDEECPGVPELTSRNQALREQLDAALEAALAENDTVTLSEIDVYLSRHLERETPLILPAFAGRTY